MKNSDFIEGVAIIGKYVKPDEYSMAAEHDELYFGSAEGMSKEDRARLRELGWSVKEDSWHCFS